MKKIFIAGPLAIKKLDKSVEEKIHQISKDGNSVLVGDANGVDRLVQIILKVNYASNVKVYANNGKTRNNVGNWEVKNIAVDKKLKGFDYYSKKDEAMAKDADYGFMIWNGKSRGTLNNIINLRKLDKSILIYLTPIKEYIYIDNDLKLEKIISKCPDKTKVIYKELLNRQRKQLSMLDFESI